MVSRVLERQVSSVSDLRPEHLSLDPHTSAVPLWLMAVVLILRVPLLPALRRAKMTHSAASFFWLTDLMRGV